MTMTRRPPIPHVLVALGLVWLTAVGRPQTTAAQELAYEHVATIPGPADLVEATDEHAYVAADKTLTVVDITDPTEPLTLGSYTFPEKIWGFTIIDELVYVAADFFGLGILDVSNATTPVLLGSVKMPGQVKNVDVSGTTAVLADHMSGVDLVDVSDRDNPVSLGSVYLDGYGRDVTVLGSLAYAVDDPSGFYVLDLSRTDSWEPMSAIQSATGPRIVEADGTLAVLLGQGALQVYDISTPTSPTHQSTYHTPGGALRVELAGAMAYLADGEEGLLVVNLDDPANPRVAGRHVPGEPVRDVAVAPGLVLLAVGPLPTGIGRSQGGGEVFVLRESQSR